MFATLTQAEVEFKGNIPKEVVNASGVFSVIGFQGNGKITCLYHLPYAVVTNP